MNATDSEIIIVATPMFADVFSGAVEEPREFDLTAPGKGHCGTDCWWHWAARSHAGRRALAELGCTVDPERPWNPGTDSWRCQPWVNPGETDDLRQFNGAADRLRAALGVPLAGVLYVERCVVNARSVKYERSAPAMIAVNEDGTRAAVARLSYCRS